MNNKPQNKSEQKVGIDNASINDAQIGQAGRDLIQAKNVSFRVVIRFFRLLSEQALKGSIVGVVIGLCLIVISHKIHDIFGFQPGEYTESTKYAEMISAIFVGIYCGLFCAHLINKTSKKVFLAVLAFLVTLWALPSVRLVFVSILETVGFKKYTQLSDTISYSISYAIICVLAGGVIETIAQITNKNRRKQNRAKSVVQSTTQVKNEILCPHCNHINPSNFKFCSKCGKELNKPFR
ncbi:zinc ribbon domain-containing protein [Scytonema hofmannii FACHB-248]|uniref:Zinc ribbon domain-containing protein n=1 Tax=Scytonema hofmannii FACHB-248 TaxID=1842502 RepID=A0ABR8H0E3_9CYAN|nr:MULTISPECIES: zinc ribbon domain-containing protein [Nostocales]MBD2608735.1 zinc ribbon domain-containing protein [Scytonema hofmannii FACHB-248]